MTAPSAPLRSCLGCPSFLTGGKVVERFGKSVSSPMCGTYGHVLGNPRMRPDEQEKAAQHFATGCPSHGHTMLPTPATRTFSVAIADPSARVTLSDLDPKKKNCSSCAMCVNYIPDDIVADETGWTAGMCAAKGKLILPNKKVTEANGCEYRKQGPVRSTTTGLMLIPGLNASTGATPSARTTAASASGEVVIIEPSEYPTDAEVTASEEKAGIRAWRRIVDPSGSGNEILIPVFNPEFFDPDERAKIPRTGDEEHPEDYVDHNGSVYKISVLWQALDETPAAWGEPGTGKTEIARHLAWLMCIPFYRISITGSSELDDLAGKMLFKKNETVFQYGRLSSAWQKHCVLILDEPNTGPPDVWALLRPLTDNSKQLALDMNEGEILPRGDYTYFMMAMNPAWDAKNVGTNVIGAADASRLMHIEFNLPPEHIERQIIAKRVLHDKWRIDRARLDFVMKVAKKIRTLCSRGELDITWAIREQIKVARALRWFSPVAAYRMAVADMLEPSQQKALLDQVESDITTFPPIEKV